MEMAECMRVEPFAEWSTCGSQSPRSPTGSLPPSPRRARQRQFGRTRTGCLTCRSRRKKCDERKPVCISCERNKLDCLFAPLVPRRNSLHGSQSLLTPPVAQAGPSSDRDDISHGISSPTALGPPDGATDPTRVLLVPVADSSGNPSRSSVPSLLLTNPSYQPDLRDASVAALLYHFCHRSSQILSSVRGKGNPFLRLMVPVAMSNEQVLEAVLALSGVHYHNLSTTTTWDAFTWSCLGKALRKLRISLELGELSSHHELLPTLMTSVILCILETVRGDATGTVASHLIAVRKLLDLYHNMPGHDAEICAFMSEYYTYSGSLSSTTGLPTNSAVSGIGEKHINDGLGIDHGETFSGSGALCGCAYNLFLEIPTVMGTIRLASLERERFGKILDSTRLDLVLSTEKIRAWSPEAENVPEDFLICGRIYQEATSMALASALVYHNTADRLDDPSSFNTTAFSYSVDASRFTTLLSQLSISSPSAQTLCWPLAVAGCCTSDTTHRAIIQQTLSIMYEGLGIGNYRNVSTWLVHDVWVAREEGRSQTAAVDVDKLFRTRWRKHGFA